MVLGGVGLLLAPDPTTITKFSGASLIMGGIGAIGGGSATIASNIKK